MKRGYLNLVRLYKFIFIINLLIFGSKLFAFYPMTWKDLMYQMKKRMSWHLAKIETNIKVFDPSIYDEDEKTRLYPIELPARGYNQVIYWKDGEILIIKTKNRKNELLHFYYENNSDILSISLNDNRTFFTEEILPRHLRFKSRFEYDRSKALKEFGIISKKVSYHIQDDNKVFLQIGNIESGHYALINPKNYELYSLHSRIWSEGNTWLDLKIIFKNYEKYRWQLYPKITEYFLDNKLFKRVTITNIRTLSTLPLKKIKKQAMNIKRSHQKTSLINDYAL